MTGQDIEPAPVPRRHSVSFNELRMSPSSASLSTRPFLERLISNKYAAAHGTASFDVGYHDMSSEVSLDLESQQQRLALIHRMRPLRLIGEYHSLLWMDNYVDTRHVKNKGLRKYYEDQNYLIERFTEIDNLLDAGKMHVKMLSTYGGVDVMEPHAEEEEASPMEHSDSTKSRFNGHPVNIDEGAQFLGYDEKKDAHAVHLAIIVNFAVNFVLLVAKVAVALLTSSLSVVASLVDSVLDFLSTLIIYVANRLSTTKNWKSEHAYPIGRSRLEPLGILVFSIIIIISFIQVGQESFKRLFLSAADAHHTVRMGWDAIAIMSLTIVLKVACWVWCSKSRSSSVQAIAQDAFTDIVFNVVSLVLPTMGYAIDVWWLDPAGALLLSIYVIISWSLTAYEHIDRLTGAVADPLVYKVVLYLAYRFAESVKQITSLKVYHVGDNVNVELDIVFDVEGKKLSFKDCHDIAEALQYSIETLPNVERAFVHVDYMEGNYKGHIK